MRFGGGSSRCGTASWRGATPAPVSTWRPGDALGRATTVVSPNSVIALLNGPSGPTDAEASAPRAVVCALLIGN
jgi:hypothetical protein